MVGRGLTRGRRDLWTDGRVIPIGKSETGRHYLTQDEPGSLVLANAARFGFLVGQASHHYNNTLSEQEAGER